ncbi:hypothetical protein QFC22_005119 [Naganishia vaughanmartiniae]|uniref:Uncharacterized protein n=1 Tax=Naganishia vaughanmartiniae TaxID=1424756 RepID=A0ACC2WYU7_9TREE|nr:hypothetical protein QFC22_005119 [Naganishia vaughanmartiniae]
MRSFKNLTHATPEQLALCPGLGDIKVRRLFDAFNLPFKVGASSRSSRSRPSAKPSTSVPQSNTTSKVKEKATGSTRANVNHNSRPDEQLTLSDVGVSMGLAEKGLGSDDSDSRIKKRKRPSNEVVVIDDDEDDVVAESRGIAGQAVEGSPDWPDMGSENGDEEVGGGKKVWKDPLSLSDDDD